MREMKGAWAGCGTHSETPSTTLADAVPATLALAAALAAALAVAALAAAALATAALAAAAAFATAALAAAALDVHVPLAVRRCRAVLALASVVLRVTLGDTLALRETVGDTLALPETVGDTLAVAVADSVALGDVETE